MKRVEAVPAHVLRDAVRAAADATSFRKVAAAARLSPRAVQLFASAATTPRARTVRLLRRWYAREQAGVSGAAAAALDTLLGDLPAGAQRIGAAEIAGIVYQLHREHGLRPPAWTVPRDTPPAKLPGPALLRDGCRPAGA